MGEIKKELYDCGKTYSWKLFKELRSLDFKIYYLREVKELKGDVGE